MTAMPNDLGPDVASDPAAGPMAADRSGGRPMRALLVWAIVLVVGWTVVLTLGGPVETAADELAAAMRPATPVTEAVARTSAATIVRLQHHELAALTPTVRHATDFGGDRWVVVYAQANPVSGVRISIDTATGEVKVATFP